MRRREPRANKYNSKYADLAALRDGVIAELQRLATNGVAPMQIDYNANRRAGPRMERVLQMLGVTWKQLVAEAGLVPVRNPQAQNRQRAYEKIETGEWLAGSMSEFLNRHERADLDDRYSTALRVTDRPTRIERFDGRTLDGHKCTITREYRMVR